MELQTGGIPLEGPGYDLLQDGTAVEIERVAVADARARSACAARTVADWNAMNVSRRGLADGWMMLDRSQTGAGKSSGHAVEFVMDWQSAGRQVLWLTPLANLAASAIKLLATTPGIRPLQGYKRVKPEDRGLHLDGSLPAFGGLVSCIDSLPSFAEAVAQSPGRVAVVVDELGYMLHRMCMEKSEKGVDVLSDFFRILRETNTPVLLMDATAGEAHVALIEAMTNRRIDCVRVAPRQRPGGTWGMPDFKAPAIEIVLADGDDTAKREGLIRECLDEVVRRTEVGQLCCVAFDNMEVLVAFVKAAQGRIDQRRILALGRFDADEKAHRAYVQRLNGIDWESDITPSVVESVQSKTRLLVAYTSVCGVGTSFDDTAGSYNAVLATSGRVDPAWVVQAVGRARQAHNAQVFIAVKNLLDEPFSERSLPEVGDVPDFRGRTVGEAVALMQAFMKRGTISNRAARWSVKLLLEDSGYIVSQTRLARVGTEAGVDDSPHVAARIVLDEVASLGMLDYTDTNLPRRWRQSCNDRSIRQQFEVMRCGQMFGLRPGELPIVEQMAFFLSLTPEGRAAWWMAYGANASRIPKLCGYFDAASKDAKSVAAVLKVIVGSDKAAALRKVASVWSQKVAAMAQRMGICPPVLTNGGLKRSGASALRDWLGRAGFSFGVDAEGDAVAAAPVWFLRAT
ncbi:hypothetical protein SAMN05216345_10716 [Cupriavidus sp. YR651]|uniref:hypothetical protein n=1 Tax=Cupriavidus sp. YR651 TaxID=1855315 RepID=UPI0008884D5B|nr:hypothetical protein [Cupriavidus sp. YR651]SDD22270.1 hypothetical protein SAMN05216345_10716 [Cupriavidus sp. YR651]